ncbi:MAG: V-type ATP synthase subunit A [Candidatus Bathyarchaeia archaeon]
MRANGETNLFGEVTGVSGPVVTVKVFDHIRDLMMNEFVFVGERRLAGEVSNMHGNTAYIQVYEDTSGLGHGDSAFRTRELISAKLGPGLVGNVYDGLQRPLNTMWTEFGPYIPAGAKSPRLPKNKRWEFSPLVKEGALVNEGDIIGVVKETELIDHKIMVPPGLGGRVIELSEGSYAVDDIVAVLRRGGETIPLALSHSWPVRKERPYLRKLEPDTPLLTGQRVLDLFLPVAKGCTVALVGGFGTGKTILHHTLARYLNVDVIIYVGCGERGNEVADLLQKFSTLADPETGIRLMNRSIIIANTSNMPVASREASVYTGLTFAEYYRDMGYDVALLIDSTTRWAEALREIASRQGIMPGEEGYPPYLASRIASNFGRAGKVECLGQRIGSVSIIGSVSPSGGDFSEPVTQKTVQVVRALWALDPELAYRRHYPAVNLQQSFTFYEQVIPPFFHEREEALQLYAQKYDLERIVRLVGLGALSDKERVTMKNIELLEDAFMKQNALHPIDAYTPLRRQIRLLDLVMYFHRSCMKALESNVPAEPLITTSLRREIEALKEVPEDVFDDEYDRLRTRIGAHMLRLVRTHA